MALPDHFEGEDVIITFEKEYETGDDTAKTTGIQNVDGKVMSWNISGGAQPTEDVYAFGGKTFNFSKPREKFSVSFDIMVNNSDFDLVNFGSSDTAEADPARIGNMTGKIVKSSDTSKRWRVVLWFQSSSSHVASGSIVVPSKSASLYRMIFTDVKSVTFDKEMSADEYMKGTLTLEFSATDSDGYANFFQEEGIGAGATTSNFKSMTTTAGGGLLREAKGYLDWNGTTAAWYTGATTTDVSKRYRYTG